MFLPENTYYQFYVWEKKGFPNPNSGFLFSLVKVDEFSGFKNPREDIYNFNVTNM